MAWWEAGLLGLLQGLTEFLPISSSAHLVLGQEALGIEGQGDLMFEVFVHLGTALSIVTLYRRRIVAIVMETAKAVRSPVAVYRQSPNARLGLFILLTLAPTGLTYVLLTEPLEAAFESTRLTYAMLLVTGMLLLLTVAKKHADGRLSPWKVLLVGVAQSAAFLPGISRSGATICAALYQNVQPQTAADFAFLMAVPVIFGAAFVKGLTLLEAPSHEGVLALTVGTAVAYLSGIVAIKVVLGFVRRGRLHYFSYYCFGIGILGLLLGQQGIS